MKEKNLVISVSGGRSSALMARHIQTDPKYKDFEKLFVFANTGMERPETIQFLADMKKHWSLPLYAVEGVYSTEMGVGARHKIVELEDLNMDALPFSQAIAHVSKGKFYGPPNSSAPYCSEYLKTRPIKNFSDEVFGVNNYIKAIGFRGEDMPKRISWAEVREENSRIFPLLTDFERPVDIGYLDKWWKRQAFRLGISSRLGNCELCWKKSEANLVNTSRSGSKFVDWFRQHEEQYKDTFFRGRKSIDDLVKPAQQPFTPELDFGEEDDKCVCSF